MTIGYILIGLFVAGGIAFLTWYGRFVGELMVRMSEESEDSEESVFDADAPEPPLHCTCLFPKHGGPLGTCIYCGRFPE